MSAAAVELPLLAAVAVALLLLFGAFIALVGAIGVLRLPYFYQRMHPSSLIPTLASGVTLLASALYFLVTEDKPVAHELVFTVFLLLTMPVTAAMVQRAAMMRDRRHIAADRGVAVGGYPHAVEPGAYDPEHVYRGHSHEGADDSTHTVPVGASRGLQPAEEPDTSEDPGIPPDPDLSAPPSPPGTLKRPRDAQDNGASSGGSAGRAPG